MKSPLLLLSLGLLVCSSSTSGNENDRIEMDAVTARKVNTIIRTVVLPEIGVPHGKRVRDISAAFLGTPYQAHTLKGSLQIPETLVANVNGVDCFTLIDYVEALSRSREANSFSRQLADVRYVNGKVGWLSRKHFFSDWFAVPPRNAEDITRTLSPQAIVVEKQLNRKADGGEFIAGLGTVPRQIAYLPAAAIDQQVLDTLHSGDYVGVYSTLAGLDVSHTGIVIKQDGKVWFRNASSLARNRKVVDTPFLQYMANKPGIVVLRAHDGS